jgi:1-acyl-sn-glycerol-3-phosphate acyltransferase
MVFGQDRHPFLKILQAVLKLFYRRHAILGADHVRADEPAVFICNHLKSYAPIVVTLYLPFRFRPWVQADVASPELCRDYLEDDFVKKELHLKPPFSRWAASAIAPLCLRLMKSIRAIPVYYGKMKIRETFQSSVDALRKGWNLVIFPESKTKGYSSHVNDFQTGFTWLAVRYFKETGHHINFYPVFVNSAIREIFIGQAIRLADESHPVLTRKDLAVYIRDAVNQMASERMVNRSH